MNDKRQLARTSVAEVNLTYFMVSRASQKESGKKQTQSTGTDHVAPAWTLFPENPVAGHSQERAGDTVLRFRKDRLGSRLCYYAAYGHSKSQLGTGHSRPARVSLRDGERLWLHRYGPWAGPGEMPAMLFIVCRQF